MYFLERLRGDLWRGRADYFANPSLKLTRYCRCSKPGPRHMVHHRESGLEHLPLRGQLINPAIK